MLDFARRPMELSPRRISAGAALSIGAHVIILGGLASLGVSRSPHSERGTEVVFVDRPVPPPLTPNEPPEAAPEPATTDPTETPSISGGAPAPKTLGFQAPSAAPEAPVNDDPYAAFDEPATAGEPDVAPGTGTSNEPPNSGGGTATGTGSSATGTGQATAVHRPKGPIPFASDMTAPRFISGRQPVYTRQALEARVEGTMIVQCIITVDGNVGGCRVLQTVPFMEEAVLGALVTRKYTPVTKNGIPLEVAYVFRVHLVMPR